MCRCLIAAALLCASNALAVDVIVNGDSNTEGVGIPGVTTPWPTVLDGLISASYVVINEGVSGRRVTPVAPGGCFPHSIPCTFRDAYTRLNLCTYAENPTVSPRPIMSFMGGTNDLRTPALSAAQIWQEYEPILDSAYRIERFVVIVMAVPPAGGSSGWNGTKQAELEALNALLSAWSVSHPGSFFVDVKSLLDVDNDDVLDAAFNSGDNLHLSQAAMNAVAAAVAATGAFP